MNPTFTFKVDPTVPHLEEIIEYIMDDFSPVKRTRKMHIDRDYLPIVVTLDPKSKLERWAPQNHNWRIIDTLFSARLIDKEIAAVLGYTQDDEGNHIFLIDRLRPVDKHPLVREYPALRALMGKHGRDHRWNLSFFGDNHLERFGKTMRDLGLGWAMSYDAEESEYRLQVQKKGTPMITMSRDHELLVTIKTVLSNLPFALLLNKDLPNYKEFTREPTDLDR